MEKVDIIKCVANSLLLDKSDDARRLLKDEYGFFAYEVYHRNYTLSQKMKIFLEDGFIDRYTGERLVNPGILKVISKCCPEEFPYHPHSKMTESHIAYWELFPTVDHIVPIACGGKDEPSNWVTTSMLHNQIKSNWTLEQLHWKLYDRGNINEWDGLTKLFLSLVEKDKNLLKDDYIKRWFRASKKVIYPEIKEI